MIKERGAATRIAGADRRGVVLGLLALPALGGSAGAEPATARTGAWRRAETARFVIHGVVSEDVLRDYAVRLEDFDMVLRFMHGLPIDAAPPRKLDIYLVRSMPNLRRAMPGAADTIRGYYIANASGIASVAMVGRAKEVENDDVMLHEYVHHFMKQYFNYAYAPWLVEGYAEYFMTMAFSSDSIVVGNLNSNRAAWLEGNWIPLDRLLTEGPRAGDPRQATYYPQAWLLTHYMMSDDARCAQLQAYMKAVGAGTPSVQAMEAATGMSLAALQKALRDYTRVGLPVRTLTRKRNQLGPGGRDLDAGLGRRSAAGDGPDDFAGRRPGRAQGLRRGRRQARRRHPGDPLAERALARARLQAEDFAGGPGGGRPAPGRAPDDVEALELKALILMAMGDAEPDRRAALYKQASEVLGRAFKIDGDRYQTLLAYARSRSLSPGYPSDNVMEALLLANELAPQVSEVTVQVVQGPGDAGRFRARGRAAQAVGQRPAQRRRRVAGAAGGDGGAGGQGRPRQGRGLGASTFSFRAALPVFGHVLIRHSRSCGEDVHRYRQWPESGRAQRRFGWEADVRTGRPGRRFCELHAARASIATTRCSGKSEPCPCPDWRRRAPVRCRTHGSPRSPPLFQPPVRASVALRPRKA
jgi:hypothetical protein